MFLDQPVNDLQSRVSALTDILDQMHAGIVVTEAPSGKLLFLNRAAVNLLGHPVSPDGGIAAHAMPFPPEFGATHNDGTLYAPDEYPTARALKGETVAAEEMLYVRSDGSTGCLRVSASPLLDAQGNTVKVIATLINVSREWATQRPSPAAEMLASSDLLLWEADIASDRLLLTGDAQRLLGYPPTLLPATLQDWLALVHPDERADLVEALTLLQDGNAPALEVEYRLRMADGQWKWLLSRGRVSRVDAAGKPLNMCGSHLDITQRKEAELRLTDAETKLRLATDIAGIGFWEWDVRSNGAYFSPQWKRLLGYRDDELPNRYEEWEDRVHPADRARVLASLHTYLQQTGDDYHIEFRLLHRDGSYRWIESKAQILRDDNARALRLLGTHLDISEHKEREEQVRLIAQHDRLTGLPNRALTFELGDQALSVAHRTGKMCAVLFLDMDGFKPINDTYGHHIGDEVLKEVAVRLKSAFRAQDIVGRIGGDEFLLVAGQLDAALGAVHAANHALQQLSLPYHIGDLVLHSSPSIGISLFPRDGADVETLVRHADEAMYEVKQQGKAGYRFFSAQAGATDARQLQHRLRESLTHQSLQLYFQPIVDVNSRRVIAAEALLRWPTPQGVAMSPDMFISIAEQSGFLDELSNWVLHQACQQHSHWQQQGLPAIDIGINLSSSQLREAGLPGAILDEIEQCAMDPAHLWLEISDRAFNGGAQYTLAALDRLKAVGVRITLDDFGVGYSTLEQLSRLPFDRVKIDRSLIAALPHDKSSVAVTEAAISFGHSLGLDVIAEGLESQQVLDFLLQRHCHRVQGFYMARPMPGPQFAEWYRGAGLQ